MVFFTLRLLLSRSVLLYNSRLMYAARPRDNRSRPHRQENPIPSVAVQFERFYLLQ